MVRYGDRIILPVSYNHLYLLGQDQQKAPKKIKHIIQPIFIPDVGFFFFQTLNLRTDISKGDVHPNCFQFPRAFIVRKH